MTKNADKSRRIALAMSGGVDSSVSAALLQEAGWTVTGVFWSGLTSAQTSERAYRDAKAVAERLAIPLLTLDVEKQRDWLVDYFVQTYAAARTPNVCVQCNQRLKFGFFREWAAAYGFATIATGHYARLKTMPDGMVTLITAADESKDQTYFLAGVEPEVWRHVQLPLGNYHKTQVRRLAVERGLPVAEKAESMEVCFVGAKKTTTFLRERLPKRPGMIVRYKKNGVKQIVGEHEGVAFYTIGQRQGLPIRVTSSHTPPYYVRGKNIANRELIVGVRDELYQDELWVGEMSSGLMAAWSRAESMDGWYVKIRHRGTLLALARIAVINEQMWRVKLREPARAVAAGQQAVFYRRLAGDEGGFEVLGAATIEG